MAMTDQSGLTGQCLCGQVAYTLPEPMLTVACHCTHCRRQSGTAFSVNVIVAESAVELSGRLQVYADQGESGQEVKRNFCPDCGSPIFSAIAAMPGILAFKAGTLDQPDLVQPVAQLYCDSALPWSSLTAITTRFPRAAPPEALFPR